MLLTSTNCKTFNKVSFKTGGLIKINNLKVKKDHPKLTNGASGSEIFDKILCDKIMLTHLMRR
jgi:hypothetical protein